MRIFSLFSGLLIAALLSLVSLKPSFAETPAASESKIRAVLKEHFPDLTVDQIRKTPITALYEVTAGSTIVYMSEDGRYAMNGDIIDLQQAQTNLTESYRKETRVKALKALSKDNMILFSPPNPKYTITVFTDVDCGYCRKMQAEMAKINSLGIAVRYLAFPRSGPGTATFEKMISIWCAKDKKATMTLASQDKSIPKSTCSNDAVMNEFKLGMSMGVQGTPTLIFEDGTLVPGYMSPEKLLEAAQELSAKKTA